MKINKKYNLSKLQSLKKRPGYRHKKYGVLSLLDSVIIKPLSTNKTYKEKKPFYIHLTTTMQCNGKCKGCINSEITFTQGVTNCFPYQINDIMPERDAKAILNLVKNIKEKEVIICFYGGEPLLVSDKIKKLINFLEKNNKDKNFKYMIYTNGKNLDFFIKNYLDLARKIWLYSVSIDGTKKQHNKIRKGLNLDKIHQNLNLLKRVKRGKVMMWSTLREEQSLLDCFNEFMYLYKNKLVDQFFWHFIETDEPYKNLSQYLIKYESDLKKIMNIYILYLKKGKILPITHVNELILYLLGNKKRNSSACGVELAKNYDIIGNKIQTCADLPMEYNLGYIKKDGNIVVKEKSLKSLVSYKNDLGCYQCGIHNYCGGRCPVQALTSKAKRILECCQLLRLHVGIIQDYIKKINDILKNKKITLQDLYNQSAHYVQFTDVTP